MAASKKTKLSPQTGCVPENGDAPPTPPNIPDTDGWLTRDQVTDMLQCTAQTIKNYENRELLHPKEALCKDRTGHERRMLVYDPKELTALPIRNRGGNPKIMVHEPGEQAARAFEMFRRGDQLDDVVIELRMTPDRVDQLYEHWCFQSKKRLIITASEKTALEQFFGPFNGVKDLVDRTSKLKQTKAGVVSVQPSDEHEKALEEDKARIEDRHTNIRAALQSKTALVARIHALTAGVGWAVIVEWQSTVHYACTLTKSKDAKSDDPDTVAAGEDLELAVRGWFSTAFPDLVSDHLQIQGPD